MSGAGGKQAIVRPYDIVRLCGLRLTRWSTKRVEPDRMVSRRACNKLTGLSTLDGKGARTGTFGMEGSEGRVTLGTVGIDGKVGLGKDGSGGVGKGGKVGFGNRGAAGNVGNGDWQRWQCCLRDAWN
ncbi:hypothetical protein ACH5RR_013283 [Cinchona calisaya]|uniref:Uncharacterized protein n=1 Tax=Cinchona calisaya TaxID=153742 RepID=A0ABD2ZZL4_9GENT